MNTYLNRFNSDILFNFDFATDVFKFTESSVIKTTPVSTGFLKIIENNKIGVYYATKNIGSLDVNNFPVPEYLQIKKIEYRYPRAETIMEIGDFLYDSFDLERESNENIRQVMSNQIS